MLYVMSFTLGFTFCLAKYAGTTAFGESCIHECNHDLMLCEDDQCVCNEAVAHTVPVFKDRRTQLRTECKKYESCNYNVRPVKSCSYGTCVYGETRFEGVCRCEEDHGPTIAHDYNNTCWPRYIAKFADFCNNAMYICDWKKRLTCRGGRCVCRKTEMYDFKLGKCVDKQPFLEKNGLTTYLGKWGDYCSDDSECFEILSCSWRNKTCECPWLCSGYVKERSSCYCGYIDVATATGPIILGILGGLAIVVFWCYRIIKLIDRHQADRFPPVTNMGDHSLASTETATVERRNTTHQSFIADNPPQYSTLNESDASASPSVPSALTPLPSASPLRGIGNVDVPPPSYSEVMMMKNDAEPVVMENADHHQDISASSDTHIPTSRPQ